MRLPAAIGAAVLAAGIAADCAAPAAVFPGTTPSPNASPLPPVPAVDGPIALRVVYPVEGGAVDARDSSFIFGSVGTGRATVTVNGQPVQVAPNGAWLGWIRFPSETLAVLDIRAVAPGQEEARLPWTVRRPPRFTPPADSRVWVDTTSFSAVGSAWWPAGEPFPLTVRATPGAAVTLLLPDGTRVPFAATAEPVAVPDGIRAFDRDPDHLDLGERSDLFRGVVQGVAWGGRRGAPRIEVALAADVVTAEWPLELALLDTLPVLAVLDDDPEGTGATDGITVGRAAPGATYHWFFARGTEVRVTGRLNDDLRIQLSDAGPTTWVPAAEVVIRPGLHTAPATVGSITMTPLPTMTAVRIPVTHRIPLRVLEEERRVTLELSHAVGDVDWFRYGAEAGDPPGAAPLVRGVSWRQDTDLVRVTFDLSRPVWGYRTHWDGNDLILEIRRPPRIDPRAPLRGLTIGVDPGHPPAGATGPTGLTEAEANLAVGQRVGALLQAAGATVFMLRNGPGPVPLADRPRLADSARVDLLVSIHNNALPDGVNPFPNNGTSVFYNHPRSIPLARAIQRHMVRRLGTRDLGIGRADLALVRPTWMPAVLVEGLFMMIPEHEAALRSPAGQELYARGVVEGVVDYLRGVSGER